MVSLHLRPASFVLLQQGEVLNLRRLRHVLGLQAASSLLLPHQEAVALLHLHQEANLDLLLLESVK